MLAIFLLKTPILDIKSKSPIAVVEWRILCLGLAIDITESPMVATFQGGDCSCVLLLKMVVPRFQAIDQ